MKCHQWWKVNAQMPSKERSESMKILPRISSQNILASEPDLGSNTENYNSEIVSGSPSECVSPVSLP